LASKRKKCTFKEPMVNKSVNSQPKKIFIIPIKQKGSSTRSDFFNEDHLKVLRVVPNEKFTLRSIKRSSKPLITRDSLYEDSKYRMKPSTTQTIEIQADLNDF
jgi:hypothetical protein